MKIGDQKKVRLCICLNLLTLADVKHVPWRGKGEDRGEYEGKVEKLKRKSCSHVLCSSAEINLKINCMEIIEEKVSSRLKLRNFKERDKKCVTCEMCFLTQRWLGLVSVISQIAEFRKKITKTIDDRKS